MAEPDLVGLPPEICVRIASFLDTKELGRLRLSCKQVEANLFDSFASEFFTKRQFMVEHISLEALLGIANHPGLASKLSEVIISSHYFAVEDMYTPDTPDHLPRAILLESGTARDMLSEAFSKLPNLKTIGLRDYNATGRDRDGRGASWKSWGWSCVPGAEILEHAEINTLFPLLLSAIEKGGSRPENIFVILRRFYLNSNAFILPLPILDGVKSIFLPVSWFAGYDRGGASWDPHYDDNNLTERPLRRFLHHTSQLEKLRVNFKAVGFTAYRLLDWLGRPAVQSTQFDLSGPSIPSAPLANLTTLEIGMAFVSGPTLVRLLTTRNLVSCSLWKVSLECPAPVDRSDVWADFLLQLSATLPSTNRLRSIMIGEVRQKLWKSGSYWRDAVTLFVPVGSDPDQKYKQRTVDKVDFKAQYTAQSAKAWLQELSTRTFVPKFHVDPEARRLSTSDGADSEYETVTVDSEDEDFSDE